MPPACGVSPNLALARMHPLAKRVLSDAAEVRLRWRGEDTDSFDRDLPWCRSLTVRFWSSGPIKPFSVPRGGLATVSHGEAICRRRHGSK